mgnify:FL=1
MPPTAMSLHNLSSDIYWRPLSAFSFPKSNSNAHQKNECIAVMNRLRFLSENMLSSSPNHPDAKSMLDTLGRSLYCDHFMGEELLRARNKIASAITFEAKK